MYNNMDLWKAGTVLPLRIHRSGVLLQGKSTALPAFSQSCPKVLTSAMEGEFSPCEDISCFINSSKISALADN